MKKTLSKIVLVTFLLLLAFGTVMNATKKDSFQLITKTKTFVAGSTVQIEFISNNTNSKPQLFVVHSYGKTVIEGENNNRKLRFTLPKLYSKKTGSVSWFLLNEEKNVLEGNFGIIPNDKTQTQIENYLGPRSILAGGAEFTMMVCVPTDAFDNPVADNTPAIIKSQFLNNITTTPEKTKDFIAWKNIYSSNTSGKIVVSTESKNSATKEIETEVYPNIATNFSINFKRNHDFADGNQITTLSTSIIKDQFKNIVSDGTLVSFIITTKNNAVLKTFGTTINGIATGQILHPDHPDVYLTKGYITGIAESNIISIDYKPIIATFNYAFSDKNRTLIVGPLKSFMNQLVPDGIKVVVKVFHNNKLESTLEEDSSKGLAKFQLSSDFYKERNYHFEITTLGITQNSETKNYETN
jgi:hypothetical protein